MERPIKVFISSRFGEFEDLRWHLRTELRDWTETNSDVELVMLDDGRADKVDASTRSLREISDSDLAVFILGNTYSDSSDDGVSITEMEFDHAVERNTQGIALDFRVWTVPATADRDERAAKFLAKAQQYKVVGSLASAKAHEQARQLGNDLRTVVAEIQTEFERGIGSTFLDVADEMLQRLSLSLNVDQKATSAEPNSRRRAFIDHRNHVVETIKNRPDLAWMEEQLTEVHQDMPDDLLTTSLLLLICQHRDRPSDRRLAVELASDITNLQERPAPTRGLSPESIERRNIELVALRARVERVGKRDVDVRDVVNRLDELESVFATHERARFNRAFLTERVMWGSIHLGLVKDSTEAMNECRKKLASRLLDLFHVYPDFAASLSVSVAIPEEVVTSVAGDVYRLLDHSFERRNNESLPQLLKRVRRHTDRLADDLSDSFLRLVGRRSDLNKLEREYDERSTQINRQQEFDESGTRTDLERKRGIIRSRQKQEIMEVVEPARNRMIDGALISSGTWEVDGHLDLVEQRVSDELRDLAGQLSVLGLPKLGAQLEPEISLEQWRARLERTEALIRVESDRIGDAQVTVSRFSRPLSTRTWMIAASIGLGVIALAFMVWWMLQGFGVSKAGFDAFTSADRQIELRTEVEQLLTLSMIVAFFVLLITSELASAAVTVGVTWALVSVISKLTNPTLGNLILALPPLAIGVPMVGLSLYFLSTKFMFLRRRLSARSATKSLSQLQTEKSVLSRSFDAMVIRDELLPKMRELVAKHSAEVGQFDEESAIRLAHESAQSRELLDDLEHSLGQSVHQLRADCTVEFQELSRLVNGYNSQFKHFPAVYNAAYVPWERAGHKELTRGSIEDSASRTGLVMGRKVDREPGFLAVPVSLTRLEETFLKWDESVSLAQDLYLSRNH